MSKNTNRSEAAKKAAATRAANKAAKASAKADAAALGGVSVDVAAERAASKARTGAKAADPTGARAPSPIRTDRKVGASKYSGLVLVRNVAANPRRPDTHGRRAFEYYAPKVGEAVAYEDFRAAVEADPAIRGGLNHIDWDVARGFVLAVPAAEFAGKVRKV